MKSNDGVDVNIDYDKLAEAIYKQFEKELPDGLKRVAKSKEEDAR